MKGGNIVIVGNMRGIAGENVFTRFETVDMTSCTDFLGKIYGSIPGIGTAVEHDIARLRFANARQGIGLQKPGVYDVQKITGTYVCCAQLFGFFFQGMPFFLCKGHEVHADGP